MAWDRWRKTGRGSDVQAEFVTGLVSETRSLAEVTVN
jgi:hypothetical protein